MKIAMLAPIAWRTPPRGYGPWEQVASNITEGLVARGHDVTLFATADSITAATLSAVCPRGYEEDPAIDAGVWKPLHYANLFERARDFDLIHSHCDFEALVFSRLIDTPMLTTIHGFSSPAIHPVYERYNDRTFYVSISDSDRYDKLDYVATVYNGIDLSQFTFRDRPDPDEYLLWLGRIHYEKGVAEAIEIAKQSGRRLILAGTIQQEGYYREKVAPHVDGKQIQYIGPVNVEQRDPLLGGALAVLHPVMRPERFGLIMPEAMAAGTPVIAFDQGSPREIIAHNQTGFVVQDVAEAVAALDRIHTINRAACRAHVEAHFTVDHMVEGYLAVYRAILHNKPKPTD